MSKIIRILQKKYCTRLLLLLWLLQILKEGTTAPAKHLKITVEGDIPKLIVTSEEEIGELPTQRQLTKSTNHKPGKLPTTTTPNIITEIQSTQLFTTTQTPKTSTTLNENLTHKIKEEKVDILPTMTTTTMQSTTMMMPTSKNEVTESLTTTEVNLIETSGATETINYITTTTTPPIKSTILATTTNITTTLPTTTTTATLPTTTTTLPIKTKTTPPPTTTTTTLPTTTTTLPTTTLTMTTTFPTTTITTKNVPTTMNLDIMLNEQQPEDEEEAVKLLDLEQSNVKPLKPKMTKAITSDNDEHIDGHDGVKRTKKKQLQIDTNILADIKSQQTTTPTSNYQYKIKLGPIHMEEKIFNSKVFKKKKAYKKVEPIITTKLLTTIKEDIKKGKINTYSHITTTPIPTTMKTKIHSTKKDIFEDNKESTITELPTTIITKIATTKDIESQISDRTTITNTELPTNFNSIKSKETESRISDIQVEVFDSNSFKESAQATIKPFTVLANQQHFTQYIVDRVESSTQQPLTSYALNKPIPAAIEIHINVSEAIGNEAEDLEFSYPQTDEKKNKTEVLLVEIIDNGGDNTTENSSEHINPIFTFQENIENEQIKSKPDELFMVSKYTTPPLPKVRQPNIDRDSDTIFYISNTEVKVGESQVPIKSAYKLSTQPNIAKSIPFHRYEEDILLSPLHDTSDALKIFRNTAEVEAPPLDVTYVGESVMEVEQSPMGEMLDTENTLLLTTTMAPSVGKIVIQPASLTDIGVPVIGELPPQIELKEFDFMPDEFPNSVVPTSHNELIENDVERLLESSVQYGADLIDEGAVDGGGGFESSYPFGNKKWHGKTHVLVNHLRKDVLNVELSEAETFNDGKKNFNDTIKELDVGNRNVTDTAMNVTYAVAERVSNATASIMEAPKETPLTAEDYIRFFTLIICLIIAIAPVFIMVSIYCALR